MSSHWIAYVAGNYKLVYSLLYGTEKYEHQKQAYKAHAPSLTFSIWDQHQDQHLINIKFQTILKKKH